MKTDVVTKVDLHVHSKYSKRPSQWVLQKIGCAESYTEPLQIYRTLRAKGMDLATITDHNTLDGCLEIADLPDTFVSEEITTYFPEDRCKVHILAYDVTEAQHVDIQKHRDNIFDLAVYLRASCICHVLAHPLFPVNDKLTLDHFEQLLLLFKNFEINGARDERLNTNLRAVLDMLAPEDIQRLENKHDRQALGTHAWRKNLTGGSDDHSSLNIARTHTLMPGRRTIAEFLSGIEQGLSKPAGKASTPQTLGHNLYSIAYQFYKQKFDLGRHVHKDMLLTFVDHSLVPGHESPTGLITSLYGLWSHRIRPRVWRQPPEQLQDLLRHETLKMIRNDPELLAIVRSAQAGSEKPGKSWFAFVNRSANQVMAHSADHLLRKLTQGSIFDVFHSLGSAGALYALLTPYFVAYALYSSDRKFSRSILDAMLAAKGKTPPRIAPRVAHFTDTFYEVNGVALTLRQQVDLAQASDKDMTIITCDPEQSAPRAGIKNFAPIGVFELPEYPELKLFYPPLLDMLQYCFDAEITHIHSATPGPIGMAALAVARLMRLPIYGTYHTSLPQYTQYLTQDFALEELMWRFVLWYYNQMDLVFAPSHSTANELIARGLAPDKVRVYPRGVDVNRFHPAKRNGFFNKNFGLGNEIKLLYVGRISKEKNLHVLEQAFAALHKERPEMRLILVGDGPYREAMETSLAGLPVVFTGYLDGEDLTQAYAGADLFVFPSATDTFGNVVLEAQASGLPVVVSAEGGPRENVIHGETGMIVSAITPEAFKTAVMTVVDTPGMLESMRTRARESMESRSFEHSFDQVWAYYGQTG